jgi:hypothetical protein
MPKGGKRARSLADDNGGEVSVTFTEKGNLGLKCTPSEETGAVVIMGINIGRQAEQHDALRPGAR